ncbi:hypothetical protein A4X06_0g1214 [Tilletia controversa]|uniref:RRM domain-containing protein n=1 Tax=Tilletia controversa TaxID=13291 RepID=A0A8X7SZH2_9BASI|nr:hypothetical protein A4X06_0g1214 [Tilletia controversa]
MAAHGRPQHPCPRAPGRTATTASPRRPRATKTANANWRSNCGSGLKVDLLDGGLRERDGCAPSLPRTGHAPHRLRRAGVALQVSSASAALTAGAGKIGPALSERWRKPEKSVVAGVVEQETWMTKMRWKTLTPEAQVSDPTVAAAIKTMSHGDPLVIVNMSENENANGIDERTGIMTVTTDAILIRVVQAFEGKNRTSLASRLVVAHLLQLRPVSLAARLVQRDLGEFLEGHLGEGTVKDVCIVMDKITKRSKGIGYVELASRELVAKALGLSGQLLFGIPILVQPSDAARNRADSGNNDVIFRPNLPGAGVPILNPALIGVPGMSVTGGPIHLGVGPVVPQGAQILSQNINTAARLYVGSLHFKLTAEDVKTVFDPFGEVEYVDLHREPGTGKSKGFAFVQFRNPPDAQKALAQMDGFVLAGRPIRVGNVNARGSGAGPSAPSATSANTMMLGARNDGGHEPQSLSSFDEGGGGRLDASARAALMQKLARVPAPEPERPAEQLRPASIPAAMSRTLQLTNMFDPAEETERDWDKDLADDVKAECERQYGPVERIHVERESLGDIYVKFGDVQAASRALQGLNGRFFGGKSIGAGFISEAIFNAKVG